MSRSSHQNHHPKLKTPPRALFSCGIFRNCTQSVLSPTAPPPSSAAFLPSTSPPPPSAPPPSASPSTQPPAQPPTQSSATSDPPQPTEAERPPPSSSSSSSSSSTSQSFTQWRFPLHHPHQQQPITEQDRRPPAYDPSTATSIDLAEAFHAAELQLASGARLPALRLLERSLAPDSPTPIPCPPAVMIGVVAALRDPASARPAAKVLLALLLVEQNRRGAVEAGASSAAMEAVAASGPAGATAERALAALELLCTVSEGAAEVREHPAAAPALAGAVEGMMGRGRECAIGVMAAIYGGDAAGAAPPEVGRAVLAAMQGECSARGRRKGAQLLRALQDIGRLDLPTDTAIGRP